jgi:hypothetical protein
MHCIARLRKALQDGYDGKPIAFDWRDDIHWPHCLDHLRQVRDCHHCNVYPVANSSQRLSYVLQMTLLSARKL